MQFGTISTDDLVLLLNLLPVAFSEEAETKLLLKQHETKIFSPEHPRIAWCHLYELPAKEHFALVLAGLGGEDALKSLSQADNQIQAIPAIVDTVLDSFPGDEWEPTKAEIIELQAFLGQVAALSISVSKSLRCMLVFGVYLNELIGTVRNGGKAADKALLAAVKIDPTVLGCPTVVARMSKALLLDDLPFLDKVRKAMEGKLTSREHKTYQNMRLVLQVLHEIGTDNLNTDDLYTLFHEELNLVRSEVGDGDVRNALRQFAYQFKKQKAVS